MSSTSDRDSHPVTPRHDDVTSSHVPADTSSSNETSLSEMSYKDQLEYLDSVLKKLNPEYRPPPEPRVNPLFDTAFAPAEEMERNIRSYESRKRRMSHGSFRNSSGKPRIRVGRSASCAAARTSHVAAAKTAVASRPGSCTEMEVGGCEKCGAAKRDRGVRRGKVVSHGCQRIVVSESERVVSDDSEGATKSDGVVSVSEKVVSGKEEVVSEDSGMRSEGEKVVSEDSKVVSGNDLLMSEAGKRLLYSRGLVSESEFSDDVFTEGCHSEEEKMLTQYKERFNIRMENTVKYMQYKCNINDGYSTTERSLRCDNLNSIEAKEFKFTPTEQNQPMLRPGSKKKTIKKRISSKIMSIFGLKKKSENIYSKILDPSVATLKPALTKGRNSTNQSDLPTSESQDNIVLSVNHLSVSSPLVRTSDMDDVLKEVDKFNIDKAHNYRESVAQTDGNDSLDRHLTLVGHKLKRSADTYNNHVICGCCVQAIGTKASIHLDNTNFTYHQTCFICKHCDNALLDKATLLYNVFVVDGYPYCDVCIKKMNMIKIGKPKKVQLKTSV